MLDTLDHEIRGVFSLKGGHEGAVEVDAAEGGPRRCITGRPGDFGSVPFVDGCHCSGEVEETGFPGSLSGALALGTLGSKVFVAVADAALHDIAGSVFGVLATSEPFTARAASVSFALAFEVG